MPVSWRSVSEPGINCGHPAIAGLSPEIAIAQRSQFVAPPRRLNRARIVSRNEAILLFAWLAVCATTELIRVLRSGIHFGFN